MPPGDLRHPVVPVSASRHCHPESVWCDLPFVGGWLRRQYVVEGGQIESAAGFQENAEVLGMAIGCANQPEQYLALEEHCLVALRIVRAAQEFENVVHSRAAVTLILERWRNAERLAAILLREP